MTIQYRFSSILSTGGERIALAPSGVTCVVGGNNVGKSQLLRELRDLAYEEPTNGRVVAEKVEASVPEGSKDESLDWLRRHAVRYDLKPGENEHFAMRIGDHGITLEGFHFWVNAGSEQLHMGNIAPFFVEYAPAGTLSQYAAGFIDPSARESNYALLKLRASGELERELSALIAEAFGENLIMDRLDVQTRLRVGSINVPVPPFDSPTQAYADALSELPTLDVQGDGFRSFVGIASLVLTHRFDVLLVDEPEAFLHPGQCRVLGRWLASQAASKNMQLIVSTHDRDFVLGLLSVADTAPVNLLRLTRSSNKTHFTQISPDMVSDVWSTPVLRYSNVLQGLFHRKVVVCESDADCRFYSAALDDLAMKRNRRAVADDTLFVPASGKAGIPSVLKAVASLGVEAWAFPDFDVLQKKAELRNIVEAMGSSWDAHLDELYTETVRQANQDKMWGQLKVSGLQALPAGSVYMSARELLKRLTSIRIHLVPSGEMESFAKHLSGHSTQWVSAALHERVHESEAVARFVAPVLSD
ncbi:ATP-dependent nuclease [Microbacterium sp. SL75]|uniref:ATP-dependent nuclease n=1 Tax=Microbacterium sp. SL75 TaxID=2995140 RepID=UPI002272239E|nr:AAA family ATPase [Microbacterium sp. SL75]WAC68547.1 AAA family ATPase [Microbacterium sp. SL75]